MLKRKVDGESEEFAGLRDSLWRFCEIMEEKKYKKKNPRLHESEPYYSVEFDAKCVDDNKKEEEETMTDKKRERNEASIMISRDLWWELKRMSVENKKKIGEYVTELLTKEVDKGKKKEASNDKDDEMKLF